MAEYGLKKYSTPRHIWFRGSRRFYERTIYTDGFRFYVKWFGNLIEVSEGEAGSNHWHTVGKQ